QALDPHLRGQRSAELVIDRDADAWPAIASESDDLRNDSVDGIDRHREADARARSRWTVDRGVDADETPRAIEQWAPRVPEIDRGVGLDYVVKLAPVVAVD